jgi:hypothetical protein
MQLEILGIRHHGVGSTINLLKRLEEISPDQIIIEGPIELMDAVNEVEIKSIKPPVAILAYNPKDMLQSTFYPYATFSPEWQAICYAKEHNIDLTMADMPLKHQFVEDDAKEPMDMGEKLGEYIVHTTPLDEIAKLDGYSDSELWWEHRFEQKPYIDASKHFEAVMLVMASLRERYIHSDDSNNLIREAFMREAIRKAIKAKKERIVFICGAWHAPALRELKSSAKSDRELMKNLPRGKVECSWVPWLNSRLSWRTGYGSGVDSANWYGHLYQHPNDDGAKWLHLATKLFRKKKIDISTAHTIEALRLAQSLASMRGLCRAGLAEFDDAIITVMCGGDRVLYDLIYPDLIVGKKMGDIGESASTLPLQRDFEAKIKSYRLQKREDEKLITLDLRKELHLTKSIFLHRLKILSIGWGKRMQSRSKGSFKEVWSLRWQPELEVAIIDKAIWGNSIEMAAQNYLKDIATTTQDTIELSHLIHRAITAKLFDSIDFLIHKIDELISLSNDVAILIETLLPLMEIARYDDIRKTDKGVLGSLIEALIIKINANIYNACYGLDNDMAQKIFKLIRAMHEAMSLWEDEEAYQEWLASLKEIANDTTMPYLIQGSTTRILFDAKVFDVEVIQKAFGKALSQGEEYIDSAYWIEGFLDGSVMVLLLDNALWGILYNWIEGLDSEEFDHILPIIRRTFSQYSPKIRFELGAKAKVGLQGEIRSQIQESEAFNEERALASMMIVKELLYGK